MKIVVVGGSGFIGSRLAKLLQRTGHAVVSASPRVGVDTITGKGLAEALDGADTVVDVSNSPSLEGAAAAEFFRASTYNILAAEAALGVKHHVALSIVGADRVASGYLRAKAIQENLIRSSAVPHTIVRSTQFFEFIAKLARPDGVAAVRLPSVFVQPIASGDVVEMLAGIAVSRPVAALEEIAGPETNSLPEFARAVLASYEDPRRVVADLKAPYFGAVLSESSLLPGPYARISPSRFGEWLREKILPG